MPTQTLVPSTGRPLIPVSNTASGRSLAFVRELQRENEAARIRAEAGNIVRSLQPEFDRVATEAESDPIAAQSSLARLLGRSSEAFLNPLAAPVIGGQFELLGDVIGKINQQQLQRERLRISASRASSSSAPKSAGDVFTNVMRLQGEGVFGVNKKTGFSGFIRREKDKGFQLEKLQTNPDGSTTAFLANSSGDVKAVEVTPATRGPRRRSLGIQTDSETGERFAVFDQEGSIVTQRIPGVSGRASRGETLSVAQRAKLQRDKVRLTRLERQLQPILTQRREALNSGRQRQHEELNEEVLQLTGKINELKASIQATEDIQQAGQRRQAASRPRRPSGQLNLDDLLESGEGLQNGF